MFEVYTGTRPGRPTVLLLLSAGALVGTLGLAWTQVRGSLALGDEVRIEGTPLIVRPPKGWAQSPGKPWLFGKWARKRGWWREVWAAERTLEFHSDSFLVHFRRLFQRAAGNPGEPARIGKWEGVQFLLGQGDRRRGNETILRAVSAAECGPISVEYTPLAEISHGDLNLLDAVCDAIRLRESRRRADPEATLAYAGVSFRLASGWELLGPENIDGPGLWVQKREEGRPVWALGVFRRRLPENIEAVRLLRLEMNEIWSRRVPARSMERSDGVSVLVALNPDMLRSGSVFASLWVIAASAREVAVIYALSDPYHGQSANGAADDLAGSIRFETPYPP